MKMNEFDETALTRIAIRYKMSIEDLKRYLTLVDRWHWEEKDVVHELAIDLALQDDYDDYLKRAMADPNCEPSKLLCFEDFNVPTIKEIE